MPSPGRGPSRQSRWTAASAAPSPERDDGGCGSPSLGEEGGTWEHPQVWLLAGEIPVSQAHQNHLQAVGLASLFKSEGHKVRKKKKSPDGFWTARTSAQRGRGSAAQIPTPTGILAATMPSLRSCISFLCSACERLAQSASGSSL